jgi:hypothetical protein
VAQCSSPRATTQKSVGERAISDKLLVSGFCDQEMRFVEWWDVDFRNHEVGVKAKPHWMFAPKNWGERAVPLPQGVGRTAQAPQGRMRRPSESVDVPQ